LILIARKLLKKPTHFPSNQPEFSEFGRKSGRRLLLKLMEIISWRQEGW
jgi:hypothetical protein